MNVAADNRPLAESGRMLSCAVSGYPLMRDVPETDQNKREGEPVPSGTKLPRGTIRFAQPVSVIYPLDIAGRRQDPVQLEEGGRSFQLESGPPAAWYEILRNH